MGKIIASFLLIAMGSAFAQTCKLQWSSEQKCLDLNALSGDRIVLPSNVTRLGQDGLTLCPIASEHSQIPAVVFIMDQSAGGDYLLRAGQMPMESIYGKYTGPAQCQPL